MHMHINLFIYGHLPRKRCSEKMIRATCSAVSVPSGYYPHPSWDAAGAPGGLLALLDAIRGQSRPPPLSRNGGRFCFIFLFLYGLR